MPSGDRQPAWLEIIKVGTPSLVALASIGLNVKQSFDLSEIRKVRDDRYGTVFRYYTTEANAARKRFDVLRDYAAVKGRESMEIQQKLRTEKAQGANQARLNELDSGIVVLVTEAARATAEQKEVGDRLRQLEGTLGQYLMKDSNANAASSDR